MTSPFRRFEVSKKCGRPFGQVQDAQPTRIKALHCRPWRRALSRRHRGPFGAERSSIGKRREERRPGYSCIRGRATRGAAKAAKADGSQPVRCFKHLSGTIDCHASRRHPHSLKAERRHHPRRESNRSLSGGEDRPRKWIPAQGRSLQRANRRGLPRSRWPP